MNRFYEITVLGNKFHVVTDLSEEEVKLVEELVKKNCRKLKKRMY